MSLEGSKESLKVQQSHAEEVFFQGVVVHMTMGAEESSKILLYNHNCNFYSEYHTN